jgi:hypothetical protein
VVRSTWHLEPRQPAASLQEIRQRWFGTTTVGELLGFSVPAVGGSRESAASDTIALRISAAGPDGPAARDFRPYPLLSLSHDAEKTMERTIEVTTRLEASAERVVEVLSTEPAGVLTGRASPNKESFAAEIAVEVGGGTSLAHEVVVVFGRLLEEGDVGRFGLSWRARP